jgi:hypothetical protein
MIAQTPSTPEVISVAFGSPENNQTRHVTLASLPLPQKAQYSQAIERKMKKWSRVLMDPSAVDFP